MQALESALVVEVPEAAFVHPWLERTVDAKPSAGVPAHVTVLFPFVPASGLDEALVGELGSLFARFDRFRFVLREALRFPEGVLYLAPEPAEPFAALTDAVFAAYPAHPPYEGQFDEVVPHLTAAEGADELLDRAHADLAPVLPIACEAREAVLLEEVEPESARWRVYARFPFRA